MALGHHYRQQHDVLRGDLDRVKEELKYEKITKENAVKALQAIEMQKCEVSNGNESLLVQYESECRIAAGLEEEKNVLQGALTAANEEVEKLKIRLKYETDRAVDAESHLTSRPTEEATINKFVKSNAYQEAVDVAVANKTEEIAKELSKTKSKAKQRKNRVWSLKAKLKGALKDRPEDVLVEGVGAQGGERSEPTEVPIAVVPLTAVVSAGTEMVGSMLLALGAAPPIGEGRKEEGANIVVGSFGEHVPDGVVEERLDAPVPQGNEGPDLEATVDPVAPEDEMDAEVAAVFYF